MAMPVGTPCAQPGDRTTRFDGAEVQAGVFRRSVGVNGQGGVGMKFLDTDLHVEPAMIAV